MCPVCPSRRRCRHIPVDRHVNFRVILRRACRSRNEENDAISLGLKYFFLCRRSGITLTVGDAKNSREREIIAGDCPYDASDCRPARPWAPIIVIRRDGIGISVLPYDPCGCYRHQARAWLRRRTGTLAVGRSTTPDKGEQNNSKRKR